MIEEDRSEAAGALLLEGPPAAQDLLIVECANVLWGEGAARGSHPRSRRRGPRRKPRRLGRIAAGYATAARAIAFDLDQTVYDSLYLAAALANGQH